MAFEHLPGIKIADIDNKHTYIVADYFSYYKNEKDPPEVFLWSDFTSFNETREAFILTAPNAQFTINKSIVPGDAAVLRIRAIIEGAIAVNPSIEHVHGRRILPVKTLCSSCDIPSEAYIANGSYTEGEINNSNVVLKNPEFYRLMCIFAPIAFVVTMVLQILYFKGTDDPANLLRYLVISLFSSGIVGMSVYLFCVFGAKTLYNKIASEDIAAFEELTFVVCEDGFMAAETEVYDFSDIIRWHQVAYFVETNHMFIIYNKNRAVFWLPKRLFPNELHKELGDFIANKLDQK